MDIVKAQLPGIPAVHILAEPSARKKCSPMPDDLASGCEIKKRQSYSAEGNSDSNKDYNTFSFLMMKSLYKTILEKFNELSGITANPTLNAFSLDFCKLLDEQAGKDDFIGDRVNKALRELELAGGIDHNDHYKNAYDTYNEAVCYLLLRDKGLKIENIKEGKKPTPDFKVEFTSKNWERVDETNTAYIEVKSLSFADGNLQYRKVQEDALKSQIGREEQHKRGKNICTGEYTVSPLGEKAIGLASEIDILIKKIAQNVKKEQFTYGNGDDTILLVDLGQYTFPFEMKECLPVYPDLIRKYSSTGRFWTVAFGHQGERIFSEMEFEGKGKAEPDLQEIGILEQFPYIKGIIFMSGINPIDKRFHGLYRYKESDLPFAFLLRKICDFVNDDRNSWGYEYFDYLDKKYSIRKSIQQGPKKYFKHYKGGKYELLAEGQHSETQEKVVVYKALFGGGKVWVRPYDMFYGNVEINGKEHKRFAEITEAEAFSEREESRIPAE